MVDENTPEAQVVDLDNLSGYLVVGLNKETGEPIVASSPGLTIPDMGMLVGRLVADMLVHISGAGAYNAIQAARAQKTGSSIVTR